jgi:hypothetical protein
MKIEGLKVYRSVKEYVPRNGKNEDIGEEI